MSGEVLPIVSGKGGGHRDTRRPTEEHRGVHNAGKRRLFHRFAKKTFGNTDSCRFLACLRTLF